MGPTLEKKKKKHTFLLLIISMHSVLIVGWLWSFTSWGQIPALKITSCINLSLTQFSLQKVMKTNSILIRNNVHKVVGYNNYYFLKTWHLEYIISLYQDDTV